MIVNFIKLVKYAEADSNTYINNNNKKKRL